MNTIHSTAIVDPAARLGHNVTVKEYAIIRGNVEVGDNCVISEYSILGVQPIIYKGWRAQEGKKGIRIGDNVVFFNGATVVDGGYENPTTIEDEVCIGHRSIVGHDSVIHRRAHLMCETLINGHIEIGALAFIGARTTFRPRSHVGANTIIGQHSNVVGDIPANCVAYGNPCKPAKQHDGSLKHGLKLLRESALDLQSRFNLEAVEKAVSGEWRVSGL